LFLTKRGRDASESPVAAFFHALTPFSRTVNAAEQDRRLGIEQLPGDAMAAIATRAPRSPLQCTPLDWLPSFREGSFMHACRPGVVAVCLLALTASMGCSGSGGGSSFDTPEACFQSIRQAALNKDIPGLCKCLTVESQNVLAGGMVMMTGMLKMMGGMAAMGGPEAAAQSQQMIAAVSAVLAKHDIKDEALAGINPSDAQAMSNPETISALADPVKNKPQFIADMFAAMEPFNQGQGFGEQFTEQIAGTLKDVKIDGDMATAIVVTTKGEEPLEFRKTAEGWKLHINLDQMAQPGPEPPAQPAESAQPAA
jgi:hypothetical protein